MAGDGRRYRFGPLERRGLIAGWRGGQIAAVAGGLSLAVLALRSRPTPLTVVAAVAAVVGGVAVAWWPVAGRTAEEWTPTVVRWAAGGIGGGRRRRSGAAGDGHCLSADGGPCQVEPPGDPPRPAGAPKRPPGDSWFRDLVLLSADPGHGPPVGVVLDRRRRTFTAALEVRGHSFALLGAREKDQRVGSWAGVLASLARERSVVHRLQWTASTLPDDGAAVARYLAERSALPFGSAAHRSYAGLLGAAGAATCRHEVLVALQVRAGGAGARSVRAAGGGDVGGCAVLLRELAALRRHLLDADVTTERVLEPRELSAVIRRAGEPTPGSPAGLDPVDAGAGPDPQPADGAVTGAVTSVPGPPAGRRCPPCPVAWPWPMASAAEWARLRTDGTWHATYWIAEWPRVDVGPDFLGPLLLGSVRRTVSVVMEPVSPSRAVRQAEQARTADMADAELRRRGGFLSTARRAREAEGAGRREEELADGHASLRFSGYVTVTAPSPELLDAACEATEQAAGQCRLELRRLYGDQEQGFANSLPLCLGLS